MILNEKELMNLGELYRELRVARGLKLKDVHVAMCLFHNYQNLKMGKQC